MTTTGVGVPDRQFLSFQLAGEEYGIGILRIREIIEYGVVTRVPMTPPWIRGVINLRGGVVPVVDLAVKFGLPAREVTARTCIVIVEVSVDGSPSLMGAVADEVSEVIEPGPDGIEPPPVFGTRVRLDCLLGMARADKRFVLLLDIDEVFSADEVLAATHSASAADAAVP
jgi:purine-binding chemotaxis protein CheW